MAENIDNKSGERVRETWPGGPCEHPKLYRELYLGSHTGDYVCASCGAMGFGSDWPAREREKKAGSS